MLVLLKNHLNYPKNSIYECFLRNIIDFSKKLYLFITS